METHPVPQQISSYQFRLVGDMTLKQFFQVGGGALISLLIYASGIHPIIKWPLILLSFSLGAALAFLPLEERPLGRWILAFFKSVYSPTYFFWEEVKTPYLFYQEEAPIPKQEGVIAPHGEVVMEEYLKSLPEEKAGFLSKLEGAESGFLSQISKLFGGNGKVTEAPTAPAGVQEQPAEEAKKEHLEVPLNTPVSIASQGFRPKIVVEETQPQEVQKESRTQTSKVAPTLSEMATQGQMVQFSPDAAPPLPPSIPNTVVGQVIDPDGKIVESAILEIRDLAGRPVRALRSNKVGHFMIVTALANGQYDIITEKEGLMFPPLTFEAKGEIIPPIAVRASAKEGIPLSVANNQPVNINSPIV